MSFVEILATSPSLFVLLVLLLGLLVGSFLNVVIYRVPVMLDRQWRAQCAELNGDNASGDLHSQHKQADGINRTSERFDLIVPRSCCPHCKIPISPRHNIPVISYFLLGGQCANCGARISARYPLVEVVTAILSAAVAWKFGFGWPAVAAPAADLVPDRSDIHRHRSSAATGQHDVASSVDRTRA